MNHCIAFIKLISTSHGKKGIKRWLSHEIIFFWNYWENWYAKI